MADSYTVHKSLEEDSDDYLFQNRQYTYITDSNNSSYNQGGQVILELSGISNSGKYLDTNQSYLSIPIVTTLYAVIVRTVRAIFTYRKYSFNVRIIARPHQPSYTLLAYCKYDRIHLQCISLY
jgi:hypothetical protein